MPNLRTREIALVEKNHAAIALILHTTCQQVGQIQKLQSEKNQILIEVLR